MAYFRKIYFLFKFLLQWILMDKIVWENYWHLKKTKSDISDVQKT